MVIKELELKNFRCYEHVQVNLHPRMNVMVGINGTGKTAILEAVRIFIGSIFVELDKIEKKISSPSILDDDVRMHNLESQYPSIIYGEAHFANFNSVSWGRVLEKRGGSTKYVDAKNLKSVIFRELSVKDSRRKYL